VRAKGRAGAYVSLEIPGIGPVEAQVRWQIGVRMGGMFMDPISLSRCEWPRRRRRRPDLSSLSPAGRG